MSEYSHEVFSSSTVAAVIIEIGDRVTISTAATKEARVIRDLVLLLASHSLRPVADSGNELPTLIERVSFGL